MEHTIKLLEKEIYLIDYRIKENLFSQYYFSVLSEQRNEYRRVIKILNQLKDK